VLTLPQSVAGDWIMSSSTRLLLGRLRGLRFNAGGLFQSELSGVRRYSVITDRCTRNLHCVESCLREAIHPAPGEPGFGELKQLFIDPDQCIGCGSCLSACENAAIFDIAELPEALRRFAELNAAYYAQDRGLSFHFRS